MEATTFLLAPATKLGQGYLFTSKISDRRQHTYGWQAGGTNATGLCSFSWNFDSFEVNSQKLGVQAPQNVEFE